MPIEVLTQLISPPGEPVETGSSDQWWEVERSLGVRLPPDYREFVSTYGSGRFARFYSILNPFAASSGLALLPTVHLIGGWLREFRQEFPERVPYPIHPEPSGLLLWGTDENGHEYYWLSEGAPEQWSVVSNEVRGLGLREHGCTMTEYLAGELRGEIEPLAGEYPAPEDLVFEPA